MKSFAMVAAVMVFGLGAMGAGAGAGTRGDNALAGDAALELAAKRAVDARLHAVLRTLLAEKSR